MRTRMYGGVTGKAGDRQPMSIVPSMFDSLEVKVLFTTWWR
jgi:hypothetical protein